MPILKGATRSQGYQGHRSATPVIEWQSVQRFYASRALQSTGSETSWLDQEYPKSSWSNSADEVITRRIGNVLYGTPK